MRLSNIINNRPYLIKNIKKHSVIESGILRNINININSNNNIPFLINKNDFKFNLSGMFSSSSFLISGNGMFYPKSCLYANTFLSVKENIKNNSLEYDIIALNDISCNTPLVLHTYNKKNIIFNIDYKYNNNLYNITEENLNKYYIKFKEQNPNVHYIEIKNYINKILNNEINIIDDNSKIIISEHPQFYGSYGVFATKNIKSGEIIEWGMQRKIDNLDGANCPYVFTWNSCGKKLISNNVWTTGSGNAIFYNSDINPNTRMYRFYNDYFFMIIANRDIKVGEELTHYYISSNWRDCFVNDALLPKISNN